MPHAPCGNKAGSGPRPTPPDNTPATAAAGPTGTLLALENGDRACYVRLQTATGEESFEGDFELCPGASRDASSLIGKPVTTTTEQANVLAAECQGDVDCGKSDVVEMIVAITAAP